MEEKEPLWKQVAFLVGNMPLYLSEDERDEVWDPDLSLAQEEKQVTLEEMRAIYFSDAYETHRKEHPLLEPSNPEKKEVLPSTFWFSPQGSLLYRHIVAEQLFQHEDYEEVNWEEWDLLYPYHLCPAIKLWMNPLTWVDSTTIEDCVVDGRVAVEEHQLFRMCAVQRIIEAVTAQRILYFADNPLLIEYEESTIGYLKHIHDWSFLTMNLNRMYFELITKRQMDAKWKDSLMVSLSYDPHYLYHSLKLVAANRGGKRAAELLRMLQKEWKSIKQLEIHFKGMSEKEIELFEDFLYSGFDELLVEWEGEKPSAQTPPKKSKRPNYELLLDWLEEEKKQGRDYLKEANYNRSEMCRNLSAFLGWEVNENSLQKAEKRRR